MPNTTGTAVGAADLLNKLNTFLTANGWTKLRGETDHNVASPKAARYWRLNVRETITTSSSRREIKQLLWRTTTGGANQATVGASYSFSSLTAGSGAELVSGTGTAPRSGSEVGTTGRWTVTYDFGSATTIRELVIQSGSNFDEAPRAFDVQWSNDNKTWTTMVSYDAAHFTGANQSVTFTWDSGAGYTDARHPSATVARRGGAATNLDATDVVDAEACDDVWAWQGPGFDAARRVYVYGAPYYETSTGTELIRFQGATAIDTGAVAWFNGAQSGSFSESAILMFASTSVTYWFYANSRRFIVVVKSGVDDYTSAYLGFMLPFANPDDFPFPLFQGATADTLTARMSTTNSKFRAFCDPGDGGCAAVRRWDNVWQRVANQQDAGGASDRPLADPSAFTWPWHVGGTDLGTSFPSTTVGGSNTFTQHFLDRIDPTSQGDLPMIPAIVMNDTFGNLGVLDGVFCVPRGGVLSPEQVVAISGTDYRIFSNRNRSGGQHYYAVRAD